MDNNIVTCAFNLMLMLFYVTKNNKGHLVWNETEFFK